MNIALTIVCVAGFSIQTIQAEQIESFNKADMAYAFGESIIDEKSVLSQREMADTEGSLFPTNYFLLPKWFERLAERAYDGMMGVFGRQSTPRVTQVHQSFNWKEYPDGPPTSNINSKRLKDVLMEVAGPPTTHDPILSKIFDNLYRTDGKVGNGSTAAATRHELATGDKVEGKYHVKKAQQRIVNLQKWVRKNPNARSSDTRAAEDAISDLQNALKFGREIDGIPVKSQIRQQPRARASDAQRIREIRELIDYQKRREELSRWMRRF